MVLACAHLGYDLPGNNDDLDGLQWYVVHHATNDPSARSLNVRRHDIRDGVNHDDEGDSTDESSEHDAPNVIGAVMTGEACPRYVVLSADRAI